MTQAQGHGRAALAAVGIAPLSALFFTMTCVLNRAREGATRVLRTDKGT